MGLELRPGQRERAARQQRALGALGRRLLARRRGLGATSCWRPCPTSWLRRRAPWLLPVRKGPVKACAIPATARALPSGYRMVDFERPPRVLVVEDDDAIAQVLQRSLRMEGYDVKHRRRRHQRARRRARVPARSRDPRPRAAADSTASRSPRRCARRRRRADPRADRARRGGVAGRGPRLRRRRLPGQAVRAPGAAGPAARAAAAPPTPRPGAAQSSAI